MPAFLFSVIFLLNIKIYIEIHENCILKRFESKDCFKDKMKMTLK